MDQVFEEKILLIEDGSYDLEYSLSNGFQDIKIVAYFFKASSQEVPDHVKMHFVKTQYLRADPSYEDSKVKYFNTTILNKGGVTLQIEMDDAYSDQIHVRVHDLRHSQAFFNGKFFSSKIQNNAKYYTQELIPSLMMDKMFLRSNSRLYGILSSSIARAVKIVTENQGHYYHLLWE